MPCTKLTTAQLADLGQAERDLAVISGNLAEAQAVLARLSQSGLPGARAARRQIGRAVCSVHEAADSLSDDVRAARESVPVCEEWEPPF